MPGSLLHTRICPTLSLSYSSWHWLFPSPKLYTSADWIPKSQGGEVGGPGSVREHTPLLFQRPPSEPESLVTMAAERGRSEGEENGSRMRKSNWERTSGPSWGPDPGRGIKEWNAGFGLVPEDQNQEEGNGEGATKTYRKTRECENSSQL